MPRRTAINRLNRLRELGWIGRTGETRATVYFLTPAGRTRLTSEWVETPFSLREEPAEYRADVAESVKRQLRRPVLERAPVGYRREFLESYQPNETFYLPETTRLKLLDIGSQPGLKGEEAGTYARHVCQRLLIDLSWNSSRLEGNTYSLLETEQLLQSNNSGDALSREAVMILNHKAAIEFLLESSAEASFDRRTILNLHALLTTDLLRSASYEGALRTDPVGIGKSAYLPLAIPALIETMFDLILSKARAIRDPFEQAFFAMVHLPYLQPFIDGNKRVSRLAANLPFFQRNLAPLSFVGVAEKDYTDAVLAVYELNEVSLLREVFVQAYERSAQRYTVIRGVMGEPDTFRVRYREAINGQVGEIIRAKLDRRQAAARLRAWAEDSVIEADRGKFIAAAEESLSGLHEGNFARYRVRPSEFEAWFAQWNRRR
ncbi:MAG TPA: Fic family protein [Luteolibacter sp.]